MSTYIDLDSTFRDKETYENPADYELNERQVCTWVKAARAVRAFPMNPNVRPLEFATTVKLIYLTLPYAAEINNLPRVYVNFESRKYRDIRLIQSIEDQHPNAKFICNFERIQNDDLGNPLWIHYRCVMEQTMRFERGDNVIFQVMSRDGSIIPNQDTAVGVPADPTKQILATFEITPYIRDGDYDNHMVETL